MARNIYMSKWLSTIGTALAAAVLLIVVLGIRLFQDVTRERFIQIELADPLFNFPGVSAHDLREIGRILESLNQSLAAEPRLKLENAALYPHRFWTALAVVAEARAEFFMNPTRDAAYRLLATQDAATQRYAEHIDAFDVLWKRSITESAPIISPKHIFDFLAGTKTDIAAFSGAIKAIKENGTILGKEIRRRRQCLRYGICQPSFQKPLRTGEITDAAVSAELPATLLPDTYLAATQEMLPATKLSARYFGVESKCFGKAAGLNWFVLWQRNYPNGAAVLFPKLATNSFYRKLDHEHFLPQDAASVRAGFSYTWQPETNLYLCPDLDYYPKLASLYSIAERITEDQLAEKLPAAVPPTLRQKVAVDEEMIIRSRFLDEYMIDHYINILQTLLPSLVDHSDLRQSVTTLIQNWETKSLRTPDVFESLAVDARRYLAMVKIAAVPITPITTTLTHSHISLGYAVWNSSVWRLAEKPNFVFIYGPESLSSDAVVDYWRLQKIFSPSTILKIQSATAEGAKTLWLLRE